MEDISKIINEANCFIDEKKANLKQYKIYDEEIKEFSKTSKVLQSVLTEKSKNLKSLIFGNKLIKFLSNTKEISKSSKSALHIIFYLIKNAPS